MRYNKIGAMKYDRIRTLQSINARKSRSAWGRAMCAASYVVKSHLKIKKHESEI